jgi:L-fucose isomerase-like protein
MLNVVAVSSPLHPAGQVKALRDTVHALLARAQAGLALQDAPDPTRPPDGVVVLTGGTEHMVLEVLQHAPGAVLLVAHPQHNALPAALEVLAWLRQRGRRGQVVLLRDDDEALAQLSRVVAGFRVARQLRGWRLGRVGAPSNWLVASSPQPAVVAGSWGPTVVDVALGDLVEAMGEAASHEVEHHARAFAAGARSVLEPGDRDLSAAARVLVGLTRVVERHRLGALSVRCFDLVTDHRTTGCMALSHLQDAGVVAGCEGDIPATLTMLWARLLTGHPSFMANPQDVDPATRTAWLTHCTIARGLVTSYTLRSHFESSLGVGISGLMPPGPVTVVRVGGAELRDLWVSDAELLENGDDPERCRTQVRVRTVEDLGPLLESPLGNHHVVVPGHHAAVFRAYHRLHVA